MCVCVCVCVCVLEVSDRFFFFNGQIYKGLREAIIKEEEMKVGRPGILASWCWSSL